MSDPHSDDPTDTLYDPPSSKSTASAPDDDTVALHLSLPKDRLERLQAVAEQLSLTPSTLAKRAIEMICDEVVTIQKDERSPSVLVEQYQARIDLLHSVNKADAPLENDAPSEANDPSEEDD